MLTYRDGEAGRAFSEMEVVAPTQEGAWPLAVLAHGGAETLDSLRDLASGMAGQGAVTYNVTYPTIIGQGQESAGSLACALRVAVDDAASHGADTSRVVVVGHDIGGNVRRSGVPGFEAGDPYSRIGGNPDLVVRLLIGDAEDRLPHQEEFAQALDEATTPATVCSQRARQISSWTDPGMKLSAALASIST